MAQTVIVGARCILALSLAGATLALATPSAEATCIAGGPLEALELTNDDGQLAIYVEYDRAGMDGGTVEVAAITHNDQVRQWTTHELELDGRALRATVPLSEHVANQLRRGAPIYVLTRAHFRLRGGIVCTGVLTVGAPLGGTAMPVVDAGSDRVMFILFGLIALGLLAQFRRETAPADRIRLAAAGGLISILFICTTFMMPWTQSAEIDGQRGGCHLGHESSCVTPLADVELGGSDDATSANQTAALAQASWEGAAVRAGQVALVLLLLPAFIWLMVAPLARPAQGLIVAGALPALVSLVATLRFYQAVGADAIRSAGAADLNLLASGSILVIGALIVIESARSGQPGPLPRATIR